MLLSQLEFGRRECDNAAVEMADGQTAVCDCCVTQKIHQYDDACGPP